MKYLFEIKMPYPIDEKSKKKIIALVLALLPEVKIYLFGSRARGTNNQWSDIDLALDAGRILPQLSIGELNDIMIASNLPYKVDIVDFNAVSKKMQEIIDQEKVIWKA